METKATEVPEVKPRAKRQILADKFDRNIYFTTREFQQEVINPVTKKRSYSITEKEVIRPDYDQHILKCRIRAAAAFDVTLEHLKSSYSVLNGKKIDGILANELIDRFGFTDGEMESRIDLATRYNLRNKAAVEISTLKLKEIIAKKDVQSAYMSYLKLVLAEAEKETSDDNLNI